MTLPAFPDEAEEKPLDPAFEKVRRKMVRLLAISIGIMMLGLMAVLFAIVYRASEGSSGLREGAIRLPARATVVSQSLSGDRLSLLIRLADGGEAILVYELGTNEVIGRYAVRAD